MGPEVRRRVACRRFHHAGHVLERRDTGPRRGQRVGLAEMRRHPHAQRRRLVHQRPQQGRRDLGVDLDVVRPARAGRRALIHGAPGLAAAGDGRGVGRGGRDAVDHRAGREHPRAERGAEVHVGLERKRRIVRQRPQVADGGDAPGDVARQRPALHVRVRVDQPRDDRLADEADHLRAARDRDLVDPRDRGEVAVLDEQHRVGDGRAARAVDERRPLERHDALPGRRARGQHRDGPYCHTAIRPYGVTQTHGLGSAEVWS